MEDKIWNAIVKRLTNTETADSQSLLEQWLTEDESHAQGYQEAKVVWELSALIQPDQPHVSFDQLQPQLIAKTQVKQLNFWKYGIAAALSAAVLLAALFQFSQDKKHNPSEEWVTRKADAGKMIQVNLPDSSKIWLNSGSEIRFHKYFSAQKSRTVQLIGEAYFDVAHDEKHPFVVESGKLTTVVYGTSFSIRAYGNEMNTSVAVNSGKVGVLIADTKEAKVPVMLVANDKLTFNRNQHTFTKLSVTNSEVNAWTAGILTFEQTPLNEVFATISRKFNVQVKADPLKYQECRLTAKFQNKPLKEVLRTLKMVMNLQTKQIDHTVYVEGGTSCSNP
ncbi:FecR family protein [Pedobacter duraquae]|nr:FecR family protein [Pedobacter duraquae]